MLDIGWSEMLIVGVVALVVVGPKDLPKMFHTIGQFTGKARGMAREFQRAMDVAAKEAGVDGFAKDIRKVTSGRAIKDAVGFDDIEKEFRDIGRDMNDVRKSPKAKTMPKADADKDAKATDDNVDADAAEPDETEADELEVQAHDMDLEARNAEMSAVEEQRLKRAKQISAARQKAADLRAAREAAEAQEQSGEPEEWRPNSKSTGTQPAESSPSTSSKPGEKS